MHILETKFDQRVVEELAIVETLVIASRDIDCPHTGFRVDQDTTKRISRADSIWEQMEEQ